MLCVCAHILAVWDRIHFAFPSVVRPPNICQEGIGHFHALSACVHLYHEQCAITTSEIKRYGKYQSDRRIRVTRSKYRQLNQWMYILVIVYIVFMIIIIMYLSTSTKTVQRRPYTFCFKSRTSIHEGYCPVHCLSNFLYQFPSVSPNFFSFTLKIKQFEQWKC